MTTARPLPKNAALVRELLLEHGPTSLDALAALLDESGVRIGRPVLESLPDRYTGTFVLADGRLQLAPQVSAGAEAAAPDETPAPEEGWWDESSPTPALPFDRVWAIDIETTGLDSSTDHIWEIAVENLATSERRAVVLRVPDGARPALVGPEADEGALPPVEGLDRIISALADHDSAVLGHNIAAFDVPFLEEFCRRHGRAWPTRPILDTLHLSVIAAPSLAHRSLADLCAHFGIELTEAHRAAADVAATVGVARRMMERIDPDEPNCALALVCLERAGDHWPRLFPPRGRIGDLVDALTPCDDPLLDARGDAAGSARDGVRLGFARLADRPGYRERPSQRQMADEVAGVLDAGGRLVVEAPTGTGKSLAYLVPALARACSSRRPVVLATHTKVLQRQLREDASTLKSLGLLAAPFRQLQGVDNYLCTREIAASIRGGEADPHEWFATAVAVRALRDAETGAWSEVNDYALVQNLPGYRQRRAGLRATTNDCDRRDCEWRDQCPLMMRLPPRGEVPGVLSVNHAVVASWVQAKAAGGTAPSDALGEDAAELVFDEAHTLEDSFTSAWAEEAGGVGIATVMRRLAARHGPLSDARAALRAAGVPAEVPDELRSARSGWFEASEAVGEAIATYLHEYARDAESAAINGPVASRRPEYRRFRDTVAELAALLARCALGLRMLADRLAGEGHSGAGIRSKRAARRLRAIERDVRELVDVLWAFHKLNDAAGFVHQVHLDPRDGERALRWLVSRTPIEIGPRFASEVVDPARSAVLTSATLAINDSFDFVASRLGLTVAAAGAVGAVTGLRLRSPFDMGRQARLILTNHLPLPVPVSESEFCEDMAADQVGFLSLSGGRALTLFAARSRMERVADLVEGYAEQLGARGVELLVQHRQTPNTIRARFRSEPGTVAFGVRSYWEGFDAPGETLSYLFIEKPPYPHPDDPLAAARQQAIADRGGDPFMDYAVPQAAIVLAQGFGRLIRTESDRGAALILDRRMQLPTVANTMLLGALPEGVSPVFADSRDDAWTEALRWVTGAVPDLAEALAVSAGQTESLLADLRSEAGADPEGAIRRAAREIFGIEQLRSEQLALMLALLADRDVLGFLPTGFGKSLCFQIPALLRPDGRPSIVISPLVALIKDQVDELRGRRRLREVHGLTGATAGAIRTDVVRELALGGVRLLYISPERLANDPTLRVALGDLTALGALVVDEAHCISSWGHDFRPEFRRISSSVVGLARSARAGFTATATGPIEADIRRSLDLKDPLVVRASADRPNLRYRVATFASEAERAGELLRLVMHQGAAPGIIYASRRATTEELAYLLRQAGVRARAYHGAMVPEQRDAVQNEFLAGDQQVIVATKAFGMGVNKSDIGWVLHYDLPESLEGYAQEAGRAGRAPGMTADCVLFVTRGDYARRRRQVERSDTAITAAVAQSLLDLIAEAPARGVGRALDPDAACERLLLTEDQLNALIARLEDLGCVARDHDCVARGKLQIGLREPPAGSEDARRFRELVRVRLGARLGVARLLDFTAMEDADAVEEELARWTLQRMVTFWPTQRHWRLRVVAARVPAAEFERREREWRGTQRTALNAMIDFAERSACRRTTLRRYFDEAMVACGEGVVACDVCARTPPPWHAVPREQVPDPEELIDVRLTLLRAVAWSRRFEGGRYAESGLRAALMGHEVFPGSGRPLGRGLLSCPQFGALQHVRASARRYDEARTSLQRDGAIAVQRVVGPRGAYDSLDITAAGSAALAGGRPS